MFQVLTTDGGPHTAETWADATAKELILVGKDAPSAPYDLAVARGRVAEALVAHHAKVQEVERASLAANPDHARTDHDVSAHLEDAHAAVVAAVAGTTWEAHFAKPDVSHAIKLVVGQHMY